jgi:hypothetical protein
MKNWIGKILITILGLALLVYSATRSVDFISMTLPADRQIMAYFGLAALDGGIIVWLMAFMYGSHGGAQRGISILMVGVDFVGAVAMFTADTILNTGEAGLTGRIDKESMLTFVVVLSLIIALNIGAGLAHHITDPDHMRKMADEEAHGKIEDQARNMVSKQADQLAAELAPVIADHWMAQTRAKYMHEIHRLDNGQPPQGPRSLPGGPPAAGRIRSMPPRMTRLQLPSQAIPSSKRQDAEDEEEDARRAAVLLSQRNGKADPTVYNLNTEQPPLAVRTGKDRS